MEMFKTLNDAAQHQPILAVGDKYKAWYANSTFVRDSLMGYNFMKEEGLLPTRETLTEKYVELGSFVGPAINEGETVFEHLEHIYGVLQGDFWSPDGQARELIISKGLSHTSMSVGNIIQMGDEFWMIKSFGFEKLF